MAIHKVALLLVFGMILLASDFEHANAKKCDPRIDFGICPYLGTKKVDGICINCCSGFKECKYFSKDYTLICDGESKDWESRKACSKECDRRIEFGICVTDLTKTVNGLCTTCSAGSEYSSSANIQVDNRSKYRNALIKMKELRLALLNRTYTSLHPYTHQVQIRIYIICLSYML
uniref:Proteinase inhibitor n=1 Tax=Solanum tuberosum TaxID=4113 RepID=M1AJ81_SOLTU